MTQDTIPKEGKVLSLLLHTCGINECEPKVISALQEYSFSFVNKLHSAASRVSELAGKESLDASDIKFAAAKLRSDSIRPNTRDYYLEVAARTNSRPFPPPLSSGPYTANIADNSSHQASYRITTTRTI